MPELMLTGDSNFLNESSGYKDNDLLWSSVMLNDIDQYQKQ